MHVQFHYLDNALDSVSEKFPEGSRMFVS